MHIMKDKVYLGVFIFLVLAIIIQSLYFKYTISQYTEFVESEITALKDTLSIYEVKEAKIINKGLNSTKKASERKTEINTKLKEDEKIINNRHVTNDDIDSLLTRFNKSSD